MDQADTLKRWIKGSSNPLPKPPKVISITSGKGGVGKSNVVANLAVAFSGLGQRVLVLDADLGLGNLDVLWGIVPKYTLNHVFAGQKSLADIVVQGPGGVRLLPTGSGSDDLTQISSELKLHLLSELDRLDQEVDLFLIDTAAGISSNVLYFNTVAQEIIVVASPEPTSLTDAYAVMKVLSKHHGEKHFKLLVNMARSEREAREVYLKLTLVSGQFLDISIDYLGWIPFDDWLKRAVCRQGSVVDLFPRAGSSEGFRRLARDILKWPESPHPKGNIQFLWRRLLGSQQEPDRGLRTSIQEGRGDGSGADGG